MSQPPGQDGDPYGRPDPGGPRPSAHAPSEPPASDEQSSWSWGEQPTETFGPYGPLPPVYGHQPTQVFPQPGAYGGQPAYGPGYGAPYVPPGGSGGYPPGSYPPGSYPPGGFPPGGFPPGGFPPGGPGRPPKGRSALPWIILAAVVVLVGVGVGGYFLVRGNRTTASTAGSTTASTPGRTSGSPAQNSAGGRTSLGTDLSQIPGGASPTGSLDNRVGGTDAGQFPGSADAATQWLQAMDDRDFQSAYELSCSEVRDTADRVAARSGTDPAQLLGASFYGDALAGKAIDTGQLTAVEYNPGLNEDMATFQLQMADGSTSTVTLFVSGDLMVCDWS